MDWCKVDQLNPGDVFVGEDGRVLTMTSMRDAGNGQNVIDCVHGAGSVSMFTTTLIKRPAEIVLRLCKGNEEIPR
jgi:hypothetical protein